MRVNSGTGPGGEHAAKLGKLKDGATIRGTLSVQGPDKGIFLYKGLRIPVSLDSPRQSGPGLFKVHWEGRTLMLKQLPDKPEAGLALLSRLGLEEAMLGDLPASKLHAAIHSRLKAGFKLHLEDPAMLARMAGELSFLELLLYLESPRAKELRRALIDIWRKHSASQLKAASGSAEEADAGIGALFRSLGKQAALARHDDTGSQQHAQLSFAFWEEGDTSDFFPLLRLSNAGSKGGALFAEVVFSMLGRLGIGVQGMYASVLCEEGKNSIIEESLRQSCPGIACTVSNWRPDYDGDLSWIEELLGADEKAGFNVMV